MAKNGHKNGQFQAFVREQLEEAQRRFSAFETDAERMLKQLTVRAKQQRKELEGLVQKLNANGLTKRAMQARSQVTKQLDVLQSRVVEAVGVASQSQIRAINKELARLSKKLDTLAGKRSPRPQLPA
jgi:hypothetical protein